MTDNTDKIIDISNPTLVVEKLDGLLKTWDKLSATFNVLLGVLGVAAIFFSLFITAFAGTKFEHFDFSNDKYIKICSFLSTLCLTVLTAFGISKRANNYRQAWRLLNSALLSYQTGEGIKIKELVEFYKKAEDIIGKTEFSFTNKNSL